MKTKVLIIIGVILLVGIGVASYFFFVKKADLDKGEPMPLNTSDLGDETVKNNLELLPSSPLIEVKKVASDEIIQRFKNLKTQ